MKDIANLILSNPKEARESVLDKLKERAFDYLDSYNPVANKKQEEKQE